MSKVYESHQIEILPGNRLIVPGCEPTSYVSSRTLSYAYAKELKCGNGYVNLKAALAGIPGSYVKYGVDWGRGGWRTRFFVFPEQSRDCPCNILVDYYAILRSLAQEDQTVTENYDYCKMNDMGFCPSPDFKDAPEPEQSPYMTDVQAGLLIGGILPPIPPWQIKS
jgi:hypothetical protein